MTFEHNTKEEKVKKKHIYAGSIKKSNQKWINSMLHSDLRFRQNAFYAAKIRPDYGYIDI